jgi:N-acetylglucosamine-6-sulfatase
MGARALLSFLAAAAAAAAAPAPARPNFIFLLNDDQDVLLNGLEDMPETLALLRAGGREYPNALVATPICCPSRTITLSGRYGHNLQEQQRQDWCGAFTGRAIENATWVTALQDAGYATGLSGKYHNAPPQGFVPRGWSDFFSLNNECTYFNNTFNDNGRHVAFGAAPSDYMTSLIGNRSLAFLRGALAAGQPFLAYIAPHAPHMPTTPAPWYAQAPLPSYAAPRTPQYNASGAGKHWVLAAQPPLSDRMAQGVDAIYTARHRALLSVDDIVREVGALLRGAGALDNTYFILTSDHVRASAAHARRRPLCFALPCPHPPAPLSLPLTLFSRAPHPPPPHAPPWQGYNLGTFRLPVEKFHFLEADIHVPFLVRGPGVAPGSVSQAIVSNVDIGATILELAGVPPAATPTDGRSFAQELLGRAPAQPPSRDRALIEYGRWGTGYVVRGPCSEGCGVCQGEDVDLNVLLDAPSNTYSALRIINATHNLAYAEFSPNSHVPQAAASTNWTELYDLAADPWQLTNLALDGSHAALLAQLSRELWAVANCSTTECP